MDPEERAFEVVATDAEGAPLETVMQAGSAAEVVASLKERGLQTSLVRRIVRAVPTPGAVSAEDFTFFNSMLATLTRHRVPMPRALEIIARDMRRGRFRCTVEDMAEAVRGGDTLAHAMAQRADVFPPLYTNLVLAGIESGRLNDVLLMMAEHAEASAALGRRVSRAVTYPVIVGIVCLFVVQGYLLYVLPRFMRTYDMLSVRLPWITRAVGALADHRAAAICATLAAIAAAMLVYRLVRSSEGGRIATDRIKLKVPLAGALWHAALLANYCKTLAILVRARVPVLRAFRLLGHASGNAAFEAATRRIAEAVSEGEAMSDVIRREPLFPPALAWQAAAGEKSGRLETVLDGLADFYRDRAERLSDLLEVVLPILLTLLLTAIVFGLVMAMFLPLRNLLSDVWIRNA